MRDARFIRGGSATAAGNNQRIAVKPKAARSVA
jgi:hypothetical protein